MCWTYCLSSQPKNVRFTPKSGHSPRLRVSADFYLSEQDTRYVFTRFGIYDDETNAFGDQQHQIRNGASAAYSRVRYRLTSLGMNNPRRCVVA
jgi:hypothetical protein